MLATYYELWAATWERAAFMKARPVAGDDDFGWRTVRAIDPMVYRSAMDVAAVEQSAKLKKRVEHEKGREAETFDVKIGSGGIRDVEFVAQAMQLLHGGHIPQVRVRSTQQALAALAEVGVLRRERRPYCWRRTGSCAARKTGCRWKPSDRCTAYRASASPWSVWRAPWGSRGRSGAVVSACAGGAPPARAGHLFTVVPRWQQ